MAWSRHYEEAYERLLDGIGNFGRRLHEEETAKQKPEILREVETILAQAKAMGLALEKDLELLTDPSVKVYQELIVAQHETSCLKAERDRLKEESKQTQRREQLLQQELEEEKRLHELSKSQATYFRKKWEATEAQKKSIAEENERLCVVGDCIDGAERTRKFAAMALHEKQLREQSDEVAYQEMEVRKLTDARQRHTEEKLSESKEQRAKQVEEHKEHLKQMQQELEKMQNERDQANGALDVAYEERKSAIARRDSAVTALNNFKLLLKQ